MDIFIEGKSKIYWEHQLDIVSQEFFALNIWIKGLNSNLSEIEVLS